MEQESVPRQCGPLAPVPHSRAARCRTGGSLPLTGGSLLPRGSLPHGRLVLRQLRRVRHTLCCAK